MELDSNSDSGDSVNNDVNNESVSLAYSVVREKGLINASANTL